MKFSAYRIKNWDAIFENNESRKLKKLNWVPLPNSWDGLGYARVTKHKNAVTILAAWPLIVQICSKCPQRGLLAKVDEPLSVEDMADLTRMPAQVFERAIDALIDPLIGWVELVDVEKGEDGLWKPIPQGETANLPQSPDTSGISGVEQNRTERNKALSPREADEKPEPGELRRPPTLPQLLEHAQKSGIEPECAEKFFLLADSRPIAPSGMWTDHDGKEMGKWPNLLQAYWISWRQRTGEQSGGNRAPRTPSKNKTSAEIGASWRQ